MDARKKSLATIFAIMTIALVIAIPQLSLDMFLSIWVWLPLVLFFVAVWILLVAWRGLLSRTMLATLVVGVVALDLVLFMAVYSKTYDSMSSVADFYRSPRVLSVLKNLSPEDGRVLTSSWIVPV